MNNAGTGPGDRATVTVFVAVTPDDAFEVFTKEIDLWWRQGPRFRIAGKKRGKLYFEPRLGGRLFESFDDSQGPRTLAVGEITAWEPPSRLELEWRNVNFKPDESTIVEVRFEASGRGTLVSVQHRGWSKIRDGHPARHGQVGAEFVRTMGLWWGDLMTSLREHTGSTRGS